MLSRIADAHFWMTRYVERTNGILRMLRVNLITSLDRSADFSWKPVLELYTELDSEGVAQLAGSSDEVLRFIIFNRNNNNSLRNLLSKARENARGMQDHVPREVWECLNALYHQINHPDIEQAIDRGEPIVMLGTLLDHTLLFNGVAEANMPRGQGWHFMNMGKFIERGIQTANILDIRFRNINYDLNNPSDIPYWRNLLLSLSGYELYLKRYRAGLQSRNVADMAILNGDFPRSILYCVSRLDKTIRDLSIEDPELTRSLQRVSGRLRSKVEYADMDSIATEGLHHFLIDIKNDIYHFSNLLARTFFAYY